jgi:hypothetical protein
LRQVNVLYFMLFRVGCRAFLLVTAESERESDARGTSRPFDRNPSGPGRGDAAPRFVRGAQRTIERHTYLPFGVGPRMCVGPSAGDDRAYRHHEELYQICLAAPDDAVTGDGLHIAVHRRWDLVHARRVCWRAHGRQMVADVSVNLRRGLRLRWKCMGILGAVGHDSGKNRRVWKRQNLHVDHSAPKLQAPQCS